MHLFYDSFHNIWYDVSDIILLEFGNIQFT